MQRDVAVVGSSINVEDPAERMDEMLGSGAYVRRPQEGKVHTRARRSLTLCRSSGSKVPSWEINRRVNSKAEGGTIEKMFSIEEN